MFIAVAKPKVSTPEKKYRQELFPDVREIKNKKLLCTSCGFSVKNSIIKLGEPIIHPFLETLLCKKCHLFYGDGIFSVDEDGTDKYCRWCGQGGTLFLCSKCSSGFCKRCVKRNLPKSAQAKIKDDNWVCYICDPCPLYELRAQCWAAQQYAAVYVKNKGSSKINKESKERYKRSHESDRSEGEELLPSKKTRKEELKGNEEKTTNRNKNKDSGGRSLRKRDSKNAKNDTGSESEDQTGNSGISMDRIHAAMNKLTGFVADIAGMTKETHKKLLECKNKKINLNNINSMESVIDINQKLNSMLITFESNVRIVREGLVEYVEEWRRKVEEDVKFKEEKEKKAEEKVKDCARLDNTIPSGSRISNKEPENGEVKNPQSDKENNNSSVKENKSPKKQSDGDNKASVSDLETEKKIPQVAEKGQEEFLEEGSDDSVVEERKVSSEVGNQALSIAETTESSNDNDPPGETSWMELFDHLRII